MFGALAGSRLCAPVTVGTSLAGRRHKRHAMTFGRQAQTTAVEARRVESGKATGRADGLTWPWTPAPTR
jgi:hypothetical protein